MTEGVLNPKQVPGDGDKVRIFHRTESGRPTSSDGVYCFASHDVTTSKGNKIGWEDVTAWELLNLRGAHG